MRFCGGPGVGVIAAGVGVSLVGGASRGDGVTRVGDAGATATDAGGTPEETDDRGAGTDDGGSTTMLGVPMDQSVGVADDGSVGDTGACSGSNVGAPKVLVTTNWLTSNDGLVAWHKPKMVADRDVMLTLA